MTVLLLLTFVLSLAFSQATKDPLVQADKVAGILCACKDTEMDLCMLKLHTILSDRDTSTIAEHPETVQKAYYTRLIEKLNGCDNVLALSLRTESRERLNMLDSTLAPINITQLQFEYLNFAAISCSCFEAQAKKTALAQQHCTKMQLYQQYLNAQSL